MSYWRLWLDIKVVSNVGVNTVGYEVRGSSGSTDSLWHVACTSRCLVRLWHWLGMNYSTSIISLLVPVNKGFRIVRVEEAFLDGSLAVSCAVDASLLERANKC